MAVSKDQPAPYATTSTIVDILNRIRDRGLQTPFTKEVLGRAGVSDSLIARTIQSLQVLDLITEDGMPTPTLESIRVAPTSEYKDRLIEWLKKAYADVFLYVDPSTDDEVAIRDAFRTYNPAGQQDRMVKLFVGLCEEAGLRVQTEKESKPRERVYSVKKTATTIRQRITPKGKPTLQAFGNYPPALAGLLSSLPPENKGWTQEQRNKFITTFGSVLDYCYPIIEDDGSEEDEGSDLV